MSATSETPPSPLKVAIRAQRRCAVASTYLDGYRRGRAAYRKPVNDVALATMTGALRAWLPYRGEPVASSTLIRALVPVSVCFAEGRHAAGNRASSYLVDLPVGDPDPASRKRRVSQAMRAHKEVGLSVGVGLPIRLSGLVPPGLNAGAARAVSGLSRHLCLSVNNIPGPQHTLYAAGPRMKGVFPSQKHTVMTRLELSVDISGVLESEDRTGSEPQGAATAAAGTSRLRRSSAALARSLPSAGAPDLRCCPGTAVSASEVKTGPNVAGRWASDGSDEVGVPVGARPADETGMS